MSETTDLYKILQIYPAFLQFMQFSKINYKSMHIQEQKYRSMQNITKLCLKNIEIIKNISILSDLC